MWAETLQCSYNCEEEKDRHVRVTENTAFHTVDSNCRDIDSCKHLLYNSLPSGLPIELLVMLYDPLFTVEQYNTEREKREIIKREKTRGELVQ